MSRVRRFRASAAAQVVSMVLACVSPGRSSAQAAGTPAGEMFSIVKEPARERDGQFIEGRFSTRSDTRWKIVGCLMREQGFDLEISTFLDRTSSRFEFLTKIKSPGSGSSLAVEVVTQAATPNEMKIFMNVMIHPDKRMDGVFWRAMLCFCREGALRFTGYRGDVMSKTVVPGLCGDLASHESANGLRRYIQCWNEEKATCSK